jgi:hypothetical protein
MQPGKPYTGSSAQTHHLPGTTDKASCTEGIMRV